MAESNGSLKTANGHGNGQRKQTNIRSRQASKRSRGFISWFTNHIGRLVTWFAILTLVFRCPSSLDACDNTSPYICKYYFQAKDVITPHVQPYYERHAQPYVDLVQPYYDSVNSRVLTPARVYAVHYGAPYVTKAQQYSQAQWEKTGQPQLQKLQGVFQTNYDQTIAPYLNEAGDALGPYYEIAKTNGLQLFYEYALPTYHFVQPYVATSYHLTSDFTTTKALPAGWWAFHQTYSFLDTTLGPHIRLVYLENVQPQLIRIGERLGRYKTKVGSGSSRASIASESIGTSTVASSFNKPTQSTSSTATAAPESTQTAEAKEAQEDDFVKPVEAPPAENNENDQRKKAREMVADDLEQWQSKFAAQADEGANDMEEKVDEIAKRMIKENAETTGQKLVDKLEALVNSEIEKLKVKISAAVQLSETSSHQAEDAALKAVRSAGVAIKRQAQAVREWRQKYDTELQNTVVRAADTHFQILDETRGLALQQIGMKWAWTEGVTYKDWAKYHELKTTFGEWTEQLKQLIVTHPSLIEAQDASAQVEDESMEIAAAAAQELGRLKMVAHWKIVAGDGSAEFGSEAMKAAADTADEARRLTQKAEVEAKQATLKAEEETRKVAAKAAEQAVKAAEAENVVVDQIKGAASASTNNVKRSASVVVEKVKGAAASAASVVSGASEAVSDKVSSAGDVAEDATSIIVDAAGHASAVADTSMAASKIATSILSEGETATSHAAEDVSNIVFQGEDIAESATDDASDASSVASESGSSVFNDASSVVSDATSTATENASDILSKASEALMGAAPTFSANMSEEISADKPEESEEVEEDWSTEKDDTPVADTTASVKPAWLGAAAQDVPSRHPILEDYDDTDVIASITSGAQGAYSKAIAAASEQYSSAASVVSAQIYGTPQPVHNQLFSSLSAGYDNALAAASSRLNDAVSVASSLKGTVTEAPKPTPYVDWSKVESIAAQRLNEGRLWAEVQYQSAIIALGLATPTPTSPSEKYYQQAKFNYYAGLGLAQDRYSKFIAAASSAMSSLTATPTPTDFAGTASSIASIARESAASFAHSAQDAAESVYSAATDNVAAAISAVDEGVNSVIDGASEQVYLAGVAIAETWDSVIAGIEGQVYGEQKQIGWYDNIFSSASTATEKMSDSAVTASAEAAKQYAAVTELVSELINGREPGFSESVVSRLNAVYATASSNVEAYASEASAAAASVGDKVGSVASQATEAIKEKVRRDEL